MTEHSITHGTFSLERTYDASRERVYAAFATAEGKAAWFEGGEGYVTLERVFDFREGGSERLTGRWESGVVSQFDARYFDIVPGERIVYGYEMRLNGTKISVSLATIEFKPAGQGTRLLLTETGAFLDGYNDAGRREHGANLLLDRVGRSLSRELAGA
ncbi:MAG TPA: SRPBCC family protein [Phenylobacterium sp.]|uniref:SRPBCC family protein n=1 Tax=Phenylobacterium sp. TaxID=1871053 RepID=UPI002BF9E8EC|nr:SRPBCC family protein [Phenylobacterium sp.]HSV01977.1 SRPBCC family protein [Phenylobacterium sp.]